MLKSVLCYLLNLKSNECQWNHILGLRKKFVQPGGKAREETVGPKSPGQMDLFGQADAVVKHVLEVPKAF